MENFEQPAVKNPVEEAKQRFNVDITNDREVMKKMNLLQGKMPDVADLSNLWRDYHTSVRLKSKKDLNLSPKMVFWIFSHSTLN